MECRIGAVHKDYKRKGVVTKLKKNMIEIGRKNGYKYIVSEATNKYSQGQNMKIGFKIQNEIYYKQWEFGGKGSGHLPYAWVVDKTGHNKIALMVYKL